MGGLRWLSYIYQIPHWHPTGLIQKGTAMSMSDPIQSAFEKFEAARLEYIATVRLHHIRQGLS